MSYRRLVLVLLSLLLVEQSCFAQCVSNSTSSDNEQCERGCAFSARFHPEDKKSAVTVKSDGCLEESNVTVGCVLFSSLDEDEAIFNCSCFTENCNNGDDKLSELLRHPLAIVYNESKADRHKISLYSAVPVFVALALALVVVSIVLCYREHLWRRRRAAPTPDKPRETERGDLLKGASKFFRRLKSRAKAPSASHSSEKSDGNGPAPTGSFGDLCNPSAENVETQAMTETTNRFGNHTQTQTQIQTRTQTQTQSQTQTQTTTVPQTRTGGTETVQAVVPLKPGKKTKKEIEKEKKEKKEKEKKLKKEKIEKEKEKKRKEKERKKKKKTTKEEKEEEEEKKDEEFFVDIAAPDENLPVFGPLLPDQTQTL